MSDSGQSFNTNGNTLYFFLKLPHVTIFDSLFSNNISIRVRSPRLSYKFRPGVKIHGKTPVITATEHFSILMIICELEANRFFPFSKPTLYETGGGVGKLPVCGRLLL